MIFITHTSSDNSTTNLFFSSPSWFSSVVGNSLLINAQLLQTCLHFFFAFLKDTPDLQGTYFYIHSTNLYLIVVPLHINTSALLSERERNSFEYSIQIQPASLETKEHISWSSCLNEFAHTALLLWDDTQERESSIHLGDKRKIDIFKWSAK